MFRITLSTASIIGTTLLIGDSDTVAAIFSNVPGAQDASATVGEGFFTVPCDSIPTISLTFAGTAFEVSPDTLNLGTVSQGSSDCVAGLMADDLGKSYNPFAPC